MNKYNSLYKQCNLKINPSKCETILFRRPLNTMGNNLREHVKNFQVTIHDCDTPHKISHKREVKYPYFHRDELLRLTSHTKTQLTKAKNSFRSNSRLFFNKNLSHRAKIICYQL